MSALRRFDKGTSLVYTLFMSKINLVPLLDACAFSVEVDFELEEAEIETFADNSIIFLNWENGKLPNLKGWLLKNYGKEVKQYEKFVIEGSR